MTIHPSWASWWGAQSTTATERLRARKWSPLRGDSVKTGPETIGAESQSFSHSLLMSPLFCLLSQFQFLRSKTLLTVKGVSSSTYQNCCTPFCYLSVQQKQPCASHLEIIRGRMLRNNSDQKLFVLKLMTKCVLAVHTWQDPIKTTIFVLQTHARINRKTPYWLIKAFLYTR